jgi:CheY-like chemotaxis protein
VRSDDYHAVGAIMAVKAALTLTPLCGATVLIFGLSVVEVVTSPDFVKLATLTLSLGALVLNLRQGNKDRELADSRGLIARNGELIEAQARTLAAQAGTLAEQQDQLDRGEAERAGQALELAQLSADLLRRQGDLQPSGSHRPLRAFSPPPSETEVLIAEDDKGTRLAMGRLLRHYGFRTTEAAGVDEALEQLRGRARHGPPFGFVLLDLRFGSQEPEGIAILRAVRQGPGAKTMAIVISGWLDEAMVERLTKHGASAVLVKPVDKARMLSLMGLHLEDPPGGDADTPPAIPRPDAPAPG